MGQSSSHAVVRAGRTAGDRWSSPWLAAHSGSQCRRRHSLGRGNARRAMSGQNQYATAGRGSLLGNNPAAAKPGYAAVARNRLATRPFHAAYRLLSGGNLARCVGGVFTGARSRFLTTFDGSPSNGNPSGSHDCSRHHRNLDRGATSTAMTAPPTTVQAPMPNYLLAEDDGNFLKRPELRPVRLQLELLKPAIILEEQGIASTLVVFGGTQIVERPEAERRLAEARQWLAADPSDRTRQRAVARAERIVAKSHFYDEAREFARLVSCACQVHGQCDFAVVTGGGPGIMEAANRGAHDVHAKSIGLNITLPEEQLPNAYITPELCFRFRYFAIRKMHFLLRAKGLVIFPGGFGTLDELFEVLTLRQVNRMQPIPVILYSRDYWSRVLDLQFLADEGTIRDEHLALVTYAETPQEAWDQLRSYYRLPEGRNARD